MDLAVVILLGVICVVNGGVLLVLIRDLRAHWQEVLAEPGRWSLQLLCTFILFFLSAFGISDYALGAVLYSKTRWVEPRSLPGTLNAQAMIPVVVLALAYITAVDIALSTLIPYIALQMLGGWVGPHVTLKLRISSLKLVMGCSMLLAALFIFVNKLGWLELAGTATGLTGWKLALLLVLGFCFGVLKALGVGSYPLTMATVNMIGLNPLVTYPLMTGSGALAIPMATAQYIRLGAYSRRITVCAATAGTVGALIAVFVVKSLNVALLQWVVAIALLFAATEMFFSSRKLRREGQ